MDLNQVVITGVLERNPIRKATETGPMAGFSIKIEETSKTTGATYHCFVPVEVFGQTCDQLQDIQAGDAALINGKLKWTSWTTKSGEKKTALAVLAWSIRRLL